VVTLRRKQFSLDAQDATMQLSMADVGIPIEFPERAVKYVLRQAGREGWSRGELDECLGALGLPSCEQILEGRFEPS
jgi:hypothetical protein